MAKATEKDRRSARASYHAAYVWRDPARWPDGQYRACLMEVGRIAGLWKFSIGNVWSRKKSVALTRCRANIAVVLKHKGLSTPQIGGLIKKDHTTVMRLLKGKVENEHVAM